jgi:DEAD/DEAH box helicase domain-containing protein
MKKEVILDVESQKLFSEVEKNNPRQLGISYVGIYKRETNTYEGFFENQLDQLWPILESSELVIGFNILKFDYAVMSAYYPGDLEKLPTFDLLDAVKDALGFRIGLDNLSRATLGMPKTGTGFEAIEFYRTGQLEKLASYCLNDVKMTKELYDYAQANRSLKYYDLNQIREFKIAIETPKTASNEFQMSLGV